MNQNNSNNSINPNDLSKMVLGHGLDIQNLNVSLLKISNILSAIAAALIKKGVVAESDVLLELVTLEDNYNRQQIDSLLKQNALKEASVVGEKSLLVCDLHKDNNPHNAPMPKYFVLNIELAEEAKKSAFLGKTIGSEVVFDDIKYTILHIYEK